MVGIVNKIKMSIPSWVLKYNYKLKMLPNVTEAWILNPVHRILLAVDPLITTKALLFRGQNLKIRIITGIEDRRLIWGYKP